MMSADSQTAVTVRQVPRPSCGRLGAVTTFALLVALIGAGTGRAASRRVESPRLHIAGRWIVDAQGRVVILHGVNVVAKHQGLTAADDGFSADDIRLLVRNGFNLVRLGLNWSSVEPHPGKIDYGYIRRYAKVYRELVSAGIYVLVDMHQDMWGPRYQGFGEPAWSDLDDGLPAAPRRGFPLNYWFMPALMRVFDNFWEDKPVDGVGLQDYYAAAWRAVASKIPDRRYLLGFDLMNEPSVGSPGPHCIAASDPTGRCRAVERTKIGPFYQRVADQIRKADRQATIWYEPQIGFNNGVPTAVPPLKRGTGATGFTFHAYCLLGGASGGSGGASAFCRKAYAGVLVNAERNPDPRAGRLLGEFGATTNLAEIRLVVDLADRHMMSWAYWQYCTRCDGLPPPGTPASRTEGIVINPARPLAGENVDPGKLRALVRPYPTLISGTPRSFSFAYGSRTFLLTYTPRRVGGGGRFGAGSITTVFVPRSKYPKGYKVRVSGARVISPTNTELLRLALCSGASEVAVKITRGRTTASARRCG